MFDSPPVFLYNRPWKGRCFAEASKDKTQLVNYQPFSGKKQILIVEDEWINRELLRAMLEDEYEILVAEDGDGALSVVREKKETLSLILLDLIMPDMNGKEVLRILKEDPTTQSIPVIVLTADQAAEVESLDLGAVDFIPKPYPQREVILARVHRTIELSEDRQILSVTERDALTGLYNKEFFYQYVEKLDALHPDVGWTRSSSISITSISSMTVSAWLSETRSSGRSATACWFPSGLSAASSAGGKRTSS